MKEIKAIIQQRKVSEVVDALAAIPGINGITAMDVRGFGRTRGRYGLEKHVVGSVNYVDKVMLLLVIPDELAEQVLREIQSKAHTGNVGDGVVFVTEVVDAIRIRTSERGRDAV